MPEPFTSLTQVATVEDTAPLTSIDNLLYTVIFSPDPTLSKAAGNRLSDLARKHGIYPASIYPLYEAFGYGKIDGFTVPAINLRTLTYDLAKEVFRIMKRHSIGAVIFEISRSEMAYTDQTPKEYALSILAAALREGYQGPIFLQGDHYQVNKEQFTANPEQELNQLQDLITESLEASFFNIDIDASTLVDLQQPTVSQQQKLNGQVTAKLTTFIRKIEPANQTISIGGEIGHIGDKNSTTSDFKAFMEIYLHDVTDPGLSKISVQTGTSHGGIPLPDGRIQELPVDFSILKAISTLARSVYHLGGAVQHGASTLPLSFFNHFVENKTLEIHLATQWMNIVYEFMPESLRSEMYAYIKENFSQERQPGWTDEQFIYKTRKKALGPFKQVLWNLSSEEKEPILNNVANQLRLIFEKLNIFKTKDVVRKYV